ncbi:MAG TPA: SGNH/GDSL hydrolase family protein [Chromatiales bacterium]|nr:SGNH/GDSL hydrolase family protein [Thiotrichales bacterium]HIP69583.1 SGNH/GDSL hydrolase family protein [Chromatiales bacterium]
MEREKTPPYKSRSKYLVFVIIMVAFTILIIEVFSWATGQILIKKWSMYAPPSSPEERTWNYTEYLSNRDPVLGWPYPREIGNGVYDEVGARPSPDFPAAQHKSCISVYGDSYTQSDLEDDSKTWAESLARLLGCRVANFGVGGYGTDQAYLRFKGNEDPHSKLVILAYFSEDMERSLTRLRDLLTYTSWYSFKPRFIINEKGMLEHLPIPSLTESEYRRLVGFEDPPFRLEHEYFNPGGDAGAVMLKFPFSFALLRNIGYYKFRAMFQQTSEFYEPNHPFRGIEIVSGIMDHFVSEANKRGKHGLIVLFPSQEDIKSFQKTGQWVHAPLRKALDRKNVPYVDFAPYFAKIIDGNNPDDYYRNYHFTAASETLFAEYLYNHLLMKGYAK